MNIPDFLTPQQVAEKLQVSAKTVNNLADAQLIEHTRIGTQRRFTEAAVQAYLKSRTIAASKNKFLKSIA